MLNCGPTDRRTYLQALCVKICWMEAKKILSPHARADEMGQNIYLFVT